MPKKPTKLKIKLTKKMILPFVVLSSLTTSFVLLFWTPPGKVKLKINAKTYTLEVAKTTPQKVKGLSKRDHLCSNCGMIFTYTFEQQLVFWMKDTYIPLDIIWLDKNGKVVQIEKNLPPESKDETGKYKLYNPASKAQYVIELNADQTDQHQLKIGDTIDLSPLEK